VAGLEMRFSRSSPFGTRRSRPAHPGESPKHTGWPRRAQRAVQLGLSAGCHPPGWRPPYERPGHAHHARAERAGRDWVGLGSTYSAFPRQGAHGLHLREGRAPPWRAVRRTRAPRIPLRARHVPVVHAERGREEHGVRSYRPRPRGSRAEHGAHVCRRSLHPCTRLTVRGSRAQPKPPQACTARARGVGRAGAGGPCGPWLSPAPAVIPRCAQRAHVRHHRVPCGAPGGVPASTPQARTARARRARHARAGRPYGPLHPHSGLRGARDARDGPRSSARGST
jgi:hypothetical protein